MTIIERLRGCPTGAAYETLCQWHTNAEMVSALATGLVTMETRDDAEPRRHFKAIWFQLVTPYAPTLPSALAPLVALA